MTVKQILGECLIKMGMQDFSVKQTYSDSEQETIDALLGALNIVYRQIVGEYLPLVKNENVTFENGEVGVSNLDESILYPIRITANAERINFKTYPDKIVADYNGKAELEYAYMPSSPFTINDSINDMRITCDALSNGTLGEYYFANKVFDLAKNFDTTFRNQMGILRYKGRCLRLKARGWQS